MYAKKCTKLIIYSFFSLEVRVYTRAILVVDCAKNAQVGGLEGRGTRLLMSRRRIRRGESNYWDGLYKTAVPLPIERTACRNCLRHVYSLSEEDPVTLVARKLTACFEYASGETPRLSQHVYGQWDGGFRAQTTSDAILCACLKTQDSRKKKKANS